MKFKRKIKSNAWKTTGSVTLEATIGVVVISFVFYVMMSLIQYVYVYKIVNSAVSVLYKSGLSSLSENVKKRLLRVTGLYENQAMAPLVTIADHAFEELDDGVYNAMMKNIIDTKIASSQQLFKIETVNLAGSEYFINDRDFVIRARFRTKSVFPLALFGKKEGYDVVVTVKGQCWTHGEWEEYNIKDIDVWNLSNFRRGRVLESIFGSNLPYDYPLIDIFNKEEKYVAVILSIDHTRKTYLEKDAIKKRIAETVKELAAFSEEDKDGISIKKKQYKQKKIILVMPENPITSRQGLELANAMTDAKMNGVEVIVKHYQVSDKE